MNQVAQTSLEALKKNLAIILGLSGLGWAVNAYALWHRQGLFANGLVEKSFCNVNKFIDCDSVAFSKYSALWGFPTAAFAMLFYAFIAVLACYAYFASQDQKKEDIQAPTRIILILSLLALIPTFALAGVSFFKLNTLCLLCLVTYLTNFALLFFAYRGNSDSRKISSSSASSLFSRASLASLFSFVKGGSFFWMALILVLTHLFIPSVVKSMVAGQGTLDASMIKIIVNKYKGQTPVNFQLNNTPSFGPANASITLVEFSDFQCPYCAFSAKTIPSFLKAYEGQVRYIYKSYPLDSACNPKMDRAAHPLGCKAAKVGYCVFKLKGDEAFFNYKSAVFAEQQRMTPESLMSDAQRTGVSESDLKTCIEDSATHQIIVDQIHEGVMAKIEGTPSVYINGKKVDSGPNPQVLAEIFDSILNK